MVHIKELEIIEEVAEQKISEWANNKASYDYLTEVRMINFGDSLEFINGDTKLNVQTELKGINVSSILLSNNTSYEKGINLANALISGIETQINDLIAISSISGRMLDMKSALKIVIDNSILVTRDNIACLRYGIAIIG